MASLYLNHNTVEKLNIYWFNNLLDYLRNCMFVAAGIIDKEKSNWLREKEPRCLEVSQI